MSSLEQIADAKIQAATQRLIADLDHEVKAIEHKNAALGVLKSGRTFKEVYRACETTLDRLLNTAKTEYGCVIKESVWPKASVPNRLISDFRRHLQLILYASKEHLEKIATWIGNNKIHERLQSDLFALRDRTLTDLSLFIDGQFQVKKNDLCKGIGAYVFGWFPRLFGFLKKG